MINLETYQTLALRTEAPMPTALARLEHAALGFISEAGEIGTQVKRIAAYGKMLDSMDKDKTLRAHIAEETGDVMWYVAIAGDTCGVNVFHVLDLVPPGLTLKGVLFGLTQAISDYLDLVDSPSFQTFLDEGAIGRILAVIWLRLQEIACLIGVSIWQIADDNIAKLALRYPDKFSVEAAEARADKGGLDARNS